MTAARRSAVFASCFLALAGCASVNLVQPPGSTVPAVANGPVNQTTLPGIIEYDHSGSDGNVAKRRADAYSEMTAACKGPYRIDDEGPEVAGSGKNYSDLWIIHFSCVPADSTASKTHS